MKRRTVLKHLTGAAAMAWMLPACIADPKKVSVALNHLNVTGDEEELLGLIAETLIPQTDTPGALAVGAHHFTLVMVDDCLPEAEQRQYMAGLRGFEKVVRDLTGASFRDATPAERESALNAFEQALADLPEEMQFFWRRTRGYVLHGYTSSQYFMTEVKPYELVPGPDYRGCVPVSGELKTIS